MAKIEEYIVSLIEEINEIFLKDTFKCVGCEWNVQIIDLIQCKIIYMTE